MRDSSQIQQICQQFINVLDQFFPSDREQATEAFKLILNQTDNIIAHFFARLSPAESYASDCFSARVQDQIFPVSAGGAEKSALERALALSPRYLVPYMVLVCRMYPLEQLQEFQEVRQGKTGQQTVQFDVLRAFKTVASVRKA